MHTRGFETSAKLTDHFDRHHSLLGIGSEAEYLTRADEFLGAARPPDVLECVKRDGDILRFRISTQEYGVLRPDRIIRTYHIRNGAGNPKRNKAWFLGKCGK